MAPKIVGAVHRADPQAAISGLAESGELPWVDARRVLQVLERLGDSGVELLRGALPQPEIGGELVLPGGCSTSYTSAAQLLCHGFRVPQPLGPRSGLAELARSMGPTTGIKYFEPPEESIRVEESGRRWEYFPRTGEISFREPRAANGSTYLDGWDYNERSGFGKHVRKGYLREAELGELLEEASRRLDIEIHDFREPPGSPDVTRLVGEIIGREPMEPSTIEQGWFLVESQNRYSGESDGWFLMYVHGAERNEYSDTNWLRSHGHELTNGIYLGIHHARNADPGERLFVSRPDYNEQSTANHLVEGRVWPVMEEEARVIAAQQPSAVREDRDDSLALHCTLSSLQYRRFGFDEYGGRSDDDGLRYAQALDVLIGRYGEETFAAAVEAMFLQHLHRLHTNVEMPGLIHAPHSDMRPMGPTATEIARDATLSLYPTPIDMSENGHVVNAKSLFGDADFWAHMSTHYPDLFERFVEYFERLPLEMEVRGTYGRGVIDPIAVIKHAFPPAFEVIHSARPSFDSSNPTPIRPDTERVEKLRSTRWRQDDGEEPKAIEFGRVGIVAPENAGNSFDNFVVADGDATRERMLAGALGFAESVEDEPSASHVLLFDGERGLGKTHLARAIVRRLEESGRSAEFFTSQRISDLFEQARAERWEIAQLWDHLRESMVNADVIVLDDFNDIGISRMVLDDVLAEAAHGGKVVIVTTNPPPRERFGESVADLLTQWVHEDTETRRATCIEHLAGSSARPELAWMTASQLPDDASARLDALVGHQWADGQSAVAIGVITEGFAAEDAVGQLRSQGDETYVARVPFAALVGREYYDAPELDASSWVVGIPEERDISQLYNLALFVERLYSLPGKRIALVSEGPIATLLDDMADALRVHGGSSNNDTDRLRDRWGAVVSRL